MFGASAALGVNVASVPAAFNATLPATVVLPVTTCTTVVPLVTARSNVTETVVASATPVAPVAGVRAVTAGGGATVVNDHDSGVIDAPAAFVAPDTVTVYVVVELNAAVGVKVAMFVVVLYAVEPTTAPPGPETAIVVPVTAWLKPTDTVVFTATFVAPEAGACDVTVGRAAVVKVHETGVIGALPAAVEPDTVTV